jgi:hypothetical protein
VSHSPSTTSTPPPLVCARCYVRGPVGIILMLAERIG